MDNLSLKLSNKKIWLEQQKKKKALYEPAY